MTPARRILAHPARRIPRRCEGHRASKGHSYRRLEVALRAAALPSVVILDLSPSSDAVAHLQRPSCTFALERYGGACVAAGSQAEEVAAGLPARASPSWLTVLRKVAQPSSAAAGGEMAPTASELFGAVLACWLGKMQPLIPAPVVGMRMRVCLQCARKVAHPMVCGGCSSVCYCSVGCQMVDLELRDRRGFCHSAYCATFHRQLCSATIRLLDHTTT